MSHFGGVSFNLNFIQHSNHPLPFPGWNFAHTYHVKCRLSFLRISFLDLKSTPKRTDRLPSSAILFFCPQHIHPSVWGRPRQLIWFRPYCEISLANYFSSYFWICLSGSQISVLFLWSGATKGARSHIFGGAPVLLALSTYICRIESSPKTRWIGNLSKSHWGSWLATFAIRSMGLTFQPEQKQNRYRRSLFFFFWSYWASSQLRSPIHYPKMETNVGIFC